MAPAGFAVTRLAVREIPRSGKPEELLDKYGISAQSHRAGGSKRVVGAVVAAPRSNKFMRTSLPTLLVLSALAVELPGHAQSELTGVQDPAWAPDGKRIAVSYLDRIFTMTPDAKQAKALTHQQRIDDEY